MKTGSATTGSVVMLKEFGLYSNKERSLEGFTHVSDVI